MGGDRLYRGHDLLGSERSRVSLIRVRLEYSTFALDDSPVEPKRTRYSYCTDCRIVVGVLSKLKRKKFQIAEESICICGAPMKKSKSDVKYGGAGGR